MSFVSAGLASALSIVAFFASSALAQSERTYVSAKNIMDVPIVRVLPEFSEGNQANNEKTEVCRITFRLKESLELFPGEFGINMTPDEASYTGPGISDRVKRLDPSNGECRLSVYREERFSFSTISKDQTFIFTHQETDSIPFTSQLRLVNSNYNSLHQKFILSCRKNDRRTLFNDIVTFNEIKKIVENYANVDLECPVAR